MLFKKKNKIKLYGYCALFTIIATSAIWYYLQLPKPLHWTLMVPWAMTICFFVMWRMSVCINNNVKTKRQKVKRYI